MAKRQDPLYTRASESDDLATIYAIIREEFTAADLQKFTVIEKGYPVKGVIKKMEAAHREETRKLKEKNKKKK